jgi:hypothetical protein
MKKIIVLIGATLLACSAMSASAASNRLPVPGENWAVTFDGPELLKVKETSYAQRYAYIANAGKLNLSLHVNKPDCAGNADSDNLVKCFGEKIRQNPYMVKNSLTTQVMADGVLISYNMEMATGNKTLRTYNLHRLFAHQGKWADLHVSVVDPAKSDLKTVSDLAESVAIVFNHP